MMEVTFSTSIFAELDRCTSNDEWLDFILPENIDNSISAYPLEDKSDDIDIDD